MWNTLSLHTHPHVLSDANAAPIGIDVDVFFFLKRVAPVSFISCVNENVFVHFLTHKHT